MVCVEDPDFCLDWICCYPHSYDKTRKDFEAGLQDNAYLEEIEDISMHLRFCQYGATNFLTLIHILLQPSISSKALNDLLPRLESKLTSLRAWP